METKRSANKTEIFQFLFIRYMKALKAVKAVHQLAITGKSIAQGQWLVLEVSTSRSDPSEVPSPHVLFPESLVLSCALKHQVFVQRIGYFKVAYTGEKLKAKTMLDDSHLLN